MTLRPDPDNRPSFQSDAEDTEVEMADLFSLVPGDSPLVVSIPHAGTRLPAGMADRLTAQAIDVPDTDWHLDRLYNFAGDLGASVLTARYSRYVVDLNRPPEDDSLYPGQATTGLVPSTTFDGEPIYRPGCEPDEVERAERLTQFWMPYHRALARRLDAVRARHGIAVLFDAHSIRSVVPRLFDGRLHDLNLGTARGASCDAALRTRVKDDLTAQSPYSVITDGRFVGGYITRHYGRPHAGIHALQLEMAQLCYMDETPPWTYRPDRAATVQPILRRMLETLRDWGAHQSGT